MSKRVLIIDDDPDICRLLVDFLEKKGFEASSANNGEAAIGEMKREPFHLVLCDFKLPDSDGLEMIQRIKILNPDAVIIIITGYSDVKMAVKTMKLGAYDYVTKPLYPDEILNTIKNGLNRKREPEPGKKKVKEAEPKPGKFIFGNSKAAETIQKHIDLIAPTDMSVVLLGETGTGKEFAARAIHDKSERSGKPFVAIDCGALPKELAGSELFGHMKGSFTGATSDKTGSFELADEGTIFLDEIANLSYENQMKLLRVLQERKIKKVGGTKDIPIDVRLITATNENLMESVRAGKFREDLYHRINEFKIHLLPLRERKGDIMVFAHHFLKIANQELGKSVQEFSEEVQEKLTNYYWHGNLRELRNMVKRAVLLTLDETMTLESLPSEIISPAYFDASPSYIYGQEETPSDLKEVAESAERRAIINVLEKTGYNKTKAAEVLNIDRKTLYNKIKSYDIKLTS